VNPSSLEETTAASFGPGRCDWCRLPRPPTRGARFCSQRCRQAAFRLRRRGLLEQTATGPLRFAYADPPYPGTARKYYRLQPGYRGEVDHRALVASLLQGGTGIVSAAWRELSLRSSASSSDRALASCDVVADGDRYAGVDDGRASLVDPVTPDPGDVVRAHA